MHLEICARTPYTPYTWLIHSIFLLGFSCRHTVVPNLPSKPYQNVFLSSFAFLIILRPRHRHAWRAQCYLGPPDASTLPSDPFQFALLFYGSQRGQGGGGFELEGQGTGTKKYVSYLNALRELTAEIAGGGAVRPA